LQAAKESLASKLRHAHRRICRSLFTGDFPFGSRAPVRRRFMRRRTLAPQWQAPPQLAPPALAEVGVKAERKVAFKKSRFMRAMNSWLMSFGQTAEHS